METSSARCCWCGGALVRYEASTESTAAPWWCATRACQERQAVWAVALQVPVGKRGKELRTVYRFVPTPKQVEFYELAAQKKRTLYGGAAGGAKSHALRWGLYRACSRIPGLTTLLLRRTFRDLEKTHLLAMAKDESIFGATYVDSKHQMRFPNGSVIFAGHCETDADARDYLSSEFDIIVFDELVTFEREAALEIMSRARTSKPAVIKEGGAKVWAGSNPGGRGALWVHDFFIAQAVDRDEFPAYRPEEFGFVRSLVDDNPYMDPQYKRDLELLPQMRRRQLLDGDWTAYEGQFFGEWRPTLDGQPWHVQDIALPKETTFFGGLDWGYNAPGVMLWIAMLPDGALHVAREYKFQQSPAEDVAKAIAKITAEMGVKLRWIAADPSIWARTGSGRGETIAETLSRAKLPMRRADNDRRNGWLRTHEWLRPMTEGDRPWLTIAAEPHCSYLRRTLPAQIQDEHDPDDVDTSKDDHAVDALRYGLMSRPAPWRTNRVEAPPPGSLGAMLADLQRSTRAVLGAGQVRR
jgi:phage terminase large subunit